MNSSQHPVMIQTGLFTDYYELTMMQGYFLQGIQARRATFDYFFRQNPFAGGYVVFAGLQDLLDTLADLHFNEESLDYLDSLGFRSDFLAYLSDFRFCGDIFAVREGDVIFPGEPVIRVSGTLAETQMLETLLLNLINFQSLIATKAARMKEVAGNRTLFDFGLRRAQGLGGIHATRAAIIGGFTGTSNVYAAKRYDIPVIGTMAHSWVQSFDAELDAFRAFARLYPNSTVLLVDTYDTLKSGVLNAITIAQEMQQRGEALKGIRLDSGDLAYFSRQARQRLDEAGFSKVKIFVSNQLDEHLIHSLISQEACIDGFGVGTRLVTGHDSPALDGVYKLCQSGEQATLKISENVQKITLPGEKSLRRFFNQEGMFYADGITLLAEPAIEVIHHPLYPAKLSAVGHLHGEDLLKLVMTKGEVLQAKQTLQEISSWSLQRRGKLEQEYRRFDNPHVYKVGISPNLLELRGSLIKSNQR